jgi:hypothetical protein
MAISKPQERISSLGRLELGVAKKFHPIGEDEKPAVREVLAIIGIEIAWQGLDVSQGGPAT